MRGNGFLITLIFVFIFTLIVIWVFYLIHPGTPIYRDYVVLDYECLGLKVASNLVLTLYQCTCSTSQCEADVLKEEVYEDGTYDSFRKMWIDVVSMEKNPVFAVNTDPTGYVTDGFNRIPTNDCVSLTEDEYVTCPRGKDLMRIGTMFVHEDGKVAGLVSGYGLIKLFENGTVDWINKL